MGIVEKKRQRIRSFQKPEVPRDFIFGVLSFIVLLLLSLAGMIIELLRGSMPPADLLYASAGLLAAALVLAAVPTWATVIALEIGGVEFKTLRLPREYVHVEGPYPLVLLLGCDVASTAQQYANHIRYFRQAGAAVIVSTIATVFGPHAVKVGQKLLDSLLTIHEQSIRNAEAGRPPGLDKEPCIGEALREAKRQALRDSLPMALCVVAFGDADWRL